MRLMQTNCWAASLFCSNLGLVILLYLTASRASVWYPTGASTDYRRGEVDVHVTCVQIGSGKEDLTISSSSWRIVCALTAPKCVCGAPPRTPLGEFTALPRPPSWWEGVSLPCPEKPPLSALHLHSWPSALHLNPYSVRLRPFGPCSFGRMILVRWKDRRHLYLGISG